MELRTNTAQFPFFTFMSRSAFAEHRFHVFSNHFLFILVGKAEILQQEHWGECSFSQLVLFWRSSSLKVELNSEFGLLVPDTFLFRSEIAAQVGRYTFSQVLIKARKSRDTGNTASHESCLRRDSRLIRVL